MYRLEYANFLAGKRQVNACKIVYCLVEGNLSLGRKQGLEDMLLLEIPGIAWKKGINWKKSIN